MLSEWPAVYVGMKSGCGLGSTAWADLQDWSVPLEIAILSLLQGQYGNF